MSDAVFVLPWLVMLGLVLIPTRAEREDRRDLRSMTRQQRAIEALRRHPERETTREAPRVARRTTGV